MAKKDLRTQILELGADKLADFIFDQAESDREFKKKVKLLESL
jgi:hypothetical protein